MATTMFQRHSIADGFTQVKHEATDRALDAARAEIGDAKWKEGFSPEKRATVRQHLARATLPVLTTLTGKLEDVGVATTQANGAEFTKLRVTLAQEDGNRVILTGDMGSEFSQRLLAKLDTATAEKQQNVTIGGFAESVSRNGRSFVNHVATLKDAQGQEIKATPGHFERAAQQGQLAAESLEKAGIKQPKMLIDAKNAARETYFKDLATELHDRLAPQRAIEAQPIEQLGQVTGRFVRSTELGDRSHIEVQRAGQTLVVDVPKNALPGSLESGSPIKLRYDRQHGVTAEVGRRQHDKSIGR